jgi:hypothetical protein
VRNIFVLKTNVLHSETGRLRMRTTSFVCRAAYVTSIYLTLAYSTASYRNHQHNSVQTHQNNEITAITAGRCALMMEAARTFETLVNFYQTTRCYNPEDSNLHLKSSLLGSMYLVPKTTISRFIPEVLAAISESLKSILKCVNVK